MQDRVYDENKGGEHAREESGWALGTEECHEGGDRRWFLRFTTRRRGRSRERRRATARRGRRRRSSSSAGSHAGIDNPDRIRDEDCSGACDGACEDGVEGGEGRGAAGAEEGRSRGLVPVVVDEVGDGDAEEGGVEARVEAGDAFALDDAPDGVVGCGLGPFGLDLGTGGEGDEGVAVGWSMLEPGLCFLLLVVVSGRWLGKRMGERGTDVRVMERRPPPAPARAWAMLSPCWAMVAGSGIGVGGCLGSDIVL